MPQFLLSYRLLGDYVTGRLENATAWMAFFDGLGDHLAELGRPVVESRTLGNCEADTRLGGYSLVEAEDIEAAVTLVKDCPALDLGAGVEVGQVGTLSGGRVVVGS
jgi:hypothetical protein